MSLYYLILVLLDDQQVMIHNQGAQSRVRLYTAAPHEEHVNVHSYYLIVDFFLVLIQREGKIFRRVGHICLFV